ncbi:MAG: Hachiman antiphage defense system protein HamA [bacterium]
MIPKYISNLISEGTLTTDEGKLINIWKLNECTDETILSEWADYFRHHYCSDEEMDSLRTGYGYTRKEFLEKIKFPDPHDPLGNATRSGDFCEILVADYAQFILNYYVPRTRYDRKVNPNSSTQGSDLMGFKVGEKVSRSDELLIFEVKAQASNTKPKKRLQDAIDDSKKDTKRIAFSLNAVNQRLSEKGLLKEAKIVQRFQNATDRPYKEKYAAAAVHSEVSFSKDILKKVITSTHIDPNLHLLVIHCRDLMAFIQELYKRASIC